MFPKTPPIPIEITHPFNFSNSQKFMPENILSNSNKNILDDAIMRKSQTKRLRDELSECIEKLKTADFIRNLKQDALNCIKEKLDKHFEDYGQGLMKNINGIEKLVNTLDEMNKQPGKTENYQVVMQCESEYRKILEKLNPPNFELIRKDEFLALKQELLALKKDKIITKSNSFGDTGKSYEMLENQLFEKNALIEKLNAEILEMRDTFRMSEKTDILINQKDLNSCDFTKLVLNIKEKADEISTYAVSDPFMGLKNSMEQNTARSNLPMENISEILQEISNQLNKGVEGIRLMVKARKEMHEKIMNQILVSNTTDIVQLNSKHEEEIKNLQQKISELCENKGILERKIENYEQENEENKKKIIDSERQNSELKNILKKTEENLVKLKLIEKEKKLADETIKRLENTVETLNDNITNRLEVDNKNLRSEIERLNSEIKILQKYRDDFNEVEREKFSEIESKHQKDLEIIRNMHKEQLDKQRMYIEKTTRENSEKIINIQKEQDCQIKALKAEYEIKCEKMKENVKKEAENSRAEYTEKLNQLKSHEQALFLRNVNLLLNKLSKEIDQIADKKPSKMRKSRDENNENNFTDFSNIESHINSMKTILENLRKMCKPNSTGISLGNIILSPIGESTKKNLFHTSTNSADVLIGDSPNMILNKPTPNKTGGQKSKGCTPAIELPEIAESAKASESESEDLINHSKSNNSTVIVNTDQRKCIRCQENDFTAPGHCQFHPFKALGTSNFTKLYIAE